MRDVISEQRKARDNEKTEKNLSDKRMRLAYLQADTSGANALDILKLQKEIAEEEENYTDSLVD
jgi:ribosome assembly protein YihI (activator of Der GTPase)